MGSELRNLWVSAGGIAPDEWTFLALEDLLLNPKSISVGVMYPGKHAEGGAPLIKVGDVANGAVVKTPDFCISESVDEEYKRTRLKGQELLLTLVGNPGDCVIVLPEMAGWNVARALAVLTLKDENLRYWLRIILLSNPLKHIIDSRLNTTVQRTLNLKDVRQLPIPLPPKSIRDYLCNIARTLELKIQLNRETNKTLEQMAQALFKSWFVDFDPVIDNALAAGKPIPEELQARAQRRQQQLAKPDHQPLPDDVRQLFPSEFEETEALGWVPKGWEVKRVDGILELAYGKALKKTDRVDGNVPVYGSGGINGYHNSSIVDGPGIVIGRKGTVGSIYWESGPFYPIDTVFFVKPIDDYSLSFCFMMLQVLGLQDMNTDAAVPGLNRNNVYRLLFPVATAELLKFLSDFLDSIRHNITLNNNETKTLTKLRDTLLPKLISGELRLPEALLDSETNPLMDEVS